MEVKSYQRKRVNIDGSGVMNDSFESHTLNEILPYLPDDECFFDTRTRVFCLLDDILPFSVTTRISANAQQYLKVRIDRKEY